MAEFERGWQWNIVRPEWTVMKVSVMGRDYSEDGKDTTLAIPCTESDYRETLAGGYLYTIVAIRDVGPWRWIVNMTYVSDIKVNLRASREWRDLEGMKRIAKRSQTPVKEIRKKVVFEIDRNIYAANVLWSPSTEEFLEDVKGLMERTPIVEILHLEKYIIRLENECTNLMMKIKLYLAERENVDTEDVDIESEDKHHVHRFVVKIGKKKWYVFANLEDAENYAIGSIASSMYCDRETWQDAFRGHYFIHENDIDQIVRDLVSKKELTNKSDDRWAFEYLCEAEKDAVKFVMEHFGVEENELHECKMLTVRFRDAAQVYVNSNGIAGSLSLEEDGEVPYVGSPIYKDQYPF